MVVKDNSTVDAPAAPLGFADIFAQLWQFKKSVGIVLIATAAISSWFALQMPNVYRTTSVLAPATEKKAGLGGLGSQLGGLASLAGLNLSAAGAIDKTDLAIELLKSKAFLASFIKNNQLILPLMATKTWDMAADQLILDDEIYDETTQSWLRDVQAPRKPEPSLTEAAEVLAELIELNKDKTTGMVKISLEYVSPKLAQQWVQDLIKAVNAEIRARDIQESENSLRYLNQQLQQTQITELRSALVQLIEDQTKTLMLANIREEYALKVVDPAYLPEEKFKPRRSAVVLFSMFGALLFLSMLAYLRCLKKQDTPL